MLTRVWIARGAAMLRPYNGADGSTMVDLLMLARCMATRGSTATPVHGDTAPEAVHRRTGPAAPRLGPLCTATSPDTRRVLAKRGTCEAGRA
jgi:hypothetical protein